MPETVEKRLEHWKSKLIDLSKRNKMINFRPTKRTTIHIVDELPGVIFKKVIAHRIPLDFLDFKSWANPNGYTSADDIPAAEYVRQDVYELAERYKDNILQTDLNQEKLNENLYMIYMKSKTSMEEQGYNTLFLALGVLEYYESEDSQERMRAPILLLPVKLKRESVRSSFQLYPLDDDFLLNPAIVLKLEYDFGIKIDDLPDDLDNVSADDVLDNFKKKISEMKRWRVLNDLYLGIFSFIKFIMYKDLDSQHELILKQPVVATLAGDNNDGLSFDPSILPDPTTLDDQLSPKDVYQVLDADSSQQAAILAAKKGMNFVLQGPPGTGKSQTIANIISECITMGKTVLFASEKMAALEVVKRRLEEAGLGDFCLELHSTKTNKREIIRELERCLRLQRVDEPERIDDLRFLEHYRKDLNEYVEVLHTPFGMLQVSPFFAHGQVAKYEWAPEIYFPIDNPLEFSHDDLEAKKRCLRDLSVTLKKVAPRNQHLWYGCQITNMDHKIETDVHRYLSDVKELIPEVETKANLLATFCDISAPRSLDEMENMIKIAKLLLESPQPEPFMLRGDGWIGLSEDVRQAVHIGTKFSEGEKMLSKYYTEGIYDLDIDGILSRKENYRSPILKLFKPSLWSNFWIDYSEFKKVVIEKPKVDYSEIISDLKIAIKVRDSGKWLDENDIKCRELFGKFWYGRETNWEKINEVVSWVNEFVKIMGVSTNEDLIKLASDPEMETEQIYDSLNALIPTLTQERANLRSLKEVLSFDESVLKEGSFEAVPFPSLHEKIDSWIEGNECLADWVDFMSAKQACEKVGFVEFLKSAFENSVNPDELIPAFIKEFYKQWLDELYLQNQILKKFKGEIHNDQIEQFKKLDKFQLQLAKARARNILSKLRPDNTWSPSSSSELGILWREIGKKRGHMPFRKLIPKIQNLLKAIKPCFMMSPLSIAQFLPPGTIEFDVIIFDEASQICPEDAIGAISRGRQLIVTGDTKQLPPTTFFQVTDIDYNTEDEDLVSDLESILDECNTINMPNLMLQWHYRSRDESLIEFSNRHFYDNNLNTFPGPYSEGKDSGVSFEYVESGVYDRGRSRKNKIEAHYVAKRVIEHAMKFPNLSLGVVSFSQPQQEAILLEIERLRRENPKLEFFFDESRSEHLFVKNLETVQGDERDVIYLSVGYGKDELGHMMMNFGPLNQEGGYRRLNVAITRAREKVVVFSSILPDDIDLSKTGNMGVKLLKYYLEFAIKGVSRFLDEKDNYPEMEFEFPFEEAVYNALTEQGLQLHKHVGRSGFRIDLAVVDEQKPGRYILGIECDGATYHRSKTARDRDRLRQEVLERLGWRIHHVWSTDWIRNPKQETERVLQAVAKAKEEVRDAEPEHSNSEEEDLQVEDFTSDSIDFKYPDRNTDEDQKFLGATSKPPEGVVPYKKTPTIPVDTSKQIYKTDIHKVSAVVSEIAKHEGPIHIQETARRVAEFWGMKKTGKRIIEIVENAVRNSESVKRKGDFLWPTEMETPPIRRCNKDDFFSRPIEYVCIEEIARTAFLVVRNEYRISREELIKQVAKILGYVRIGDTIQNRIEEGIEPLLEFKGIGHDDEGFWRLQ
jgi:very-short-patch-repair endonuclease